MRIATYPVYTFDELSDEAKEWETFHDEIKLLKGDLHAAFNEAIEAAVKDIVRDMEYQNSDACVDEIISINEYEFYEDGSRAR